MAATGYATTYEEIASRFRSLFHYLLLQRYDIETGQRYLKEESRLGIPALIQTEGASTLSE